MDQRNLIHPLTAGDLVESAVIVAQVTSLQGGTEIRRLVVVAVEWDGDGQPPPGAHPHTDRRVKVTAVDRQTREIVKLNMKASTPILVTDISL